MIKYLHTLAFVLFASIQVFGAIVITFPSDRAVFQRNHDNEATIYISGYITEPFSSIEAQLTPIVPGEGEQVAWTTIDSNPTGGNYYGSVIAKGGWYQLEVRGIKSGQSPKVTSLAHVGVGEVFIIAGQSNATGGDGNANGPSATHDQVNSVNYQNPASYADIKLPCPNFVHLDAAIKTAPFGNYAWCWGSFGDKVYEKFRVPVMIFNTGWSSTSVVNWQQTINPEGVTISPFGFTFPQGLPFGHLRSALNYYAAQLGVRAILWHQGESDNYLEKGGSPEINWQDQYRKGLWDVIQGTRNLSGKPDLAWIVARASRFDYPLNSGITTVSGNVIAAQNELIDTDMAYPHVYQGPDTDPYYTTEYRSDQIHFRGDGVTPSPDGNTYSGLIHLAGFWADHITSVFLNSSVPYPATPPPHVSVVQTSGSPNITFTAPTTTPAPQYNWFLPATNCNEYVNHSQQWTTGAGTYQLKMVDNLNNTVLSPKLYVSDNTALPVTWLYFIAQLSPNGRPSLRWATSSETNASHFEIQRSQDAKAFVSVASVAAAGESKGLKEYQFEDESILAGTYYYRLKEVDLDGGSDLSRVTTLKISGNGVLKIFPNPVADKVTMQGDLPLNLVEIFNHGGKKLYSEMLFGKMAEIDLSRFSDGLYIIRANGASFKIVKGAGQP